MLRWLARTDPSLFDLIYADPPYAAGLYIPIAAAVLKGGENYGSIVTPGDPKKSSLITIIQGQDEDLPQPEKHKLSLKQVELVKRWISQGAK